MFDEQITFDDSYFRDPHEFYLHLQSSGVVHKFTAPSGTSGWVVTDRDLARTALSHPSLGKGHAAMTGSQSSAGLIGRLHRMATSYVITHMLGSNPPDHARLRKAASRWFSPAAVDDLTPTIEALTADLIRSMRTQAAPDLVRDFAFTLPVQVICRILGVDDRHSARIGECSRVLSDVVVADPNELRRAAVDIARLILPTLAMRRFRPQDDLISDLAGQQRAGELATKEALSTIALLLIAGHETTSSLIVNAMLALTGDSELKARAARDPQALDQVIEETLRIEPPLPVTTLREALEPLTLGGQHIGKGEMVMVSVLAANLDAKTATDPTSFDAARAVQRHMSFGYGIHYCLGAGLARREAHVAISQLLLAFPEIELAIDRDDVSWRRSVFFRRADELPISINT